MVFLGPVKGACRPHVDENLLAVARLEHASPCPGYRRLGLGSIENCRAVLHRALPRHRLLAAHDVEQTRIRHAARIIVNLNHLGVARATGTDRFISGFVERTARVADGGLEYARYLTESLLDPPESASAEDRPLYLEG